MSSDALEQAQVAFQEGKASESLLALEAVFREGDSANHAAGHLLKGLIYEYGGEGVQVDLPLAINHYRMASHLIGNSDPAPFLYLGRAFLKQGAESSASALKSIDQARSIRHTPEVDLAFAAYYEATNFKSTVVKKYYAKAALKGRFAGFFGLASVLRREGKHLTAMLVDVVRVLVGPILFIALGRSARKSFNSY